VVDAGDVVQGLGLSGLRRVVGCDGLFGGFRGRVVKIN